MTYMPTVVAIPNLDAQLEVLKARGLDPAINIICAPSAGTPGFIKGIAGCRHYQRCIFGKKEFGAGKGKGVHEIPYFIDPRDGLNHATEMHMACTLFMQMMVPRMKAGQDAILEGLDGEQIEVVMDEENPTELAKTVIMTGFVPVKDALGNTTGYQRTDTEVPVPAYKYPQEREHKAVSKVRERHARRQRRNPNSPEFTGDAEPEVLDMTNPTSESRRERGAGKNAS